MIDRRLPFLLTNLLLDELLLRPSSRVINVLSMGHTVGEIHFDDPNLTGNFTGMAAYCQSKLAHVVFTQEFARRTEGTSLVTHDDVTQSKLSLWLRLNTGGRVRRHGSVA